MAIVTFFRALRDFVSLICAYVEFNEIDRLNVFVKSFSKWVGRQRDIYINYCRDLPGGYSKSSDLPF